MADPAAGITQEEPIRSVKLLANLWGSHWLLRAIKGYEYKLSSNATFDPNDSRVAIGSEDGSAYVWNAMNPRPITVWSKHPENYEFLALDFESSRYLTTSAADNTVILQNINTCKLIQTYRGHKGKVLHARFSQDGSRVLTTSEDKTAIIWDVAHGREIAKLVGHQDAVIFGTFSPDGKRVITQSNDKTLRIWDAFNGQAIATLSGYPGEIESPMFSPDGTRIIVDTFRYEDSNNSDNQIWTAWLWDAGTGVVVGSVDGHTAPSAFSPDGTQVITISKDSRASVSGIWYLVAPQLILRA